ncbi:MAG: hypothetical protein ACKVKR_08975, partial [Pseudomonadales bacterium]
QGVGVQVPSPAHYSLADLRYLQLSLSKVNFCRVLGGGNQQRKMRCTTQMRYNLRCTFRVFFGSFYPSINNRP